MIMTQIPALSFKRHLVADASLGHTDHGMDLMFIVPHLVLNGEMIIQIGHEIRELFGILAVRKETDSEDDVEELHTVSSSLNRTILGLPPREPLKIDDIKNA